MSKPIEVGTNFHVAYTRAIEDEQIRGRIALFVWIASLFFPASLDMFGLGFTQGWVIFWWVGVVFTFIGMSFHWSTSAVQHRAYHKTTKDLF